MEGDSRAPFHRRGRRPRAHPALRPQVGQPHDDQDDHPIVDGPADRAGGPDPRRDVGGLEGEHREPARPAGAKEWLGQRVQEAEHAQRKESWNERRGCLWKASL